MATNKVPHNLKTTPLYPLMVEKGGVFTEFGGFYMPVNFSEGIIAEHLAVRNDVGLFDVSHMGQIRIKGQEAEDFVNYVSTNNIKKCRSNQMQYQIVTQEDGGVVDDMMGYKFNENDLWLVCNAGNKDVLFAHLKEVLKQTKYKCELIDETDDYAAIALQGPNSLAVLEQALELQLADLKFLEFIETKGLVISRSGYTGEDGFEIYGFPEPMVQLTKKLFTLGAKPCGLGSRDTLRFEAGLPLFGHEISNFITPVQAGLLFAIDFKKADFIGKDALYKQHQKKPKEKIQGLVLLKPGVARQGYSIYDDDKYVGYITSGFMIPGTKNSYANGLIDSSYKIGDELEIEIRNRRVKAQIRKKRYL
ncbi:MAG: glycine cleavage system aminomethyltransferase GcvT [Acholeplasmataceae bacterium]|jgi:aminomethyltransferase|nr:glycine cleavage system aminomethyltransferase GcvT [Acholeplasmataceae bacterium]